MTQQTNIEQLKQVAREKLHTAGVDGFAIDLDLEALDEIVTSTYLQAVEDGKERCGMRMKAGNHLTKYVKDYSLVNKGMVATLCCCHDAFVIETDEELSEVIKNLKDEEEELKYTVVRLEDAFLVCGDYDTTIEQINCSRVRKLQSLKQTKEDKDK